jgi:DNA-directed RNA polymerase subunit N (RpoN/RPB10)
MLVPVRCFTCGKPLSHLWNSYLEQISKSNNVEDISKEENDLTISDKEYNTPENRAFTKLGIKKYCCRSVMLGTIDMTEKITR